MKVKTQIRAGNNLQDLYDSLQDSAESTLSALRQNSTVRQAGQVAKKLWYWPFSVPRQ